ncbi:hypothetical protein GPECTOR_8g85 [Gonium pectorale]|uniref:Polycystin cation channel PKD1/PKD2 domain-containing protein n=1 Tax=Gonium pectorale TaxID=33097 RepID=A0A150GTI9_GONPE|nr:hypothetical protein GPECTOR_8g85 [Gonium pectorale]|eukprot:KXZ53094.1 hypothetical protein GPECTOR_8g85 [Gonium pectorale]
MCAFPNADPDYDETRVAEAAELAAKFGGLWLRAALPHRPPAPHSLMVVTVRHVDGNLSLVHADNMRPLEPGCSLFTGDEATLTAAHPQLPRGLHYVPANMYDWGTAEPRYMTVHFAAPGRLFVLLPEDTVEPRWLREQFFKLREPLYGIKVCLRCDWHETRISEAVMRILTASRKSDKAGNLVVYKSKRLYRAGDVAYLGGVPTAHFADSMYVLCAASASECEVQMDARVAGPAKTENISDWAVWYPRMLKSIRRNRLEDVRLLLKSDAWTQRPFRSDPISWLPPDEVEERGKGGASPLTSDLAVANGNVEMLALLVSQCHCQLSVRGLRLLMHKWEEVPAAHGGALELLLVYLRRCPRPLGTLACFLNTLRREIERRDRARSSSTLELRAVLRRFEELQTQLLYAVADVVRHGGPDGARSGSQSLSWLQGVVDPPQNPRPVVLSDHSPLRIAFDDRDYGFMASVVMEGYTRQKWMGAAYLALTSRDGTGGLTILDPTILLTVMHRMGLCDNNGILSAALFNVARMWYLASVVPGAFINSPRGRWWMRLLAVTAFIVTFNVVLSRDAEVERTSTLISAGFFCAFLLGSLVEAVETVAVAYQGSISRLELSDLTYLRLVMTWASLAVVFYVKFLYTLVPLVQRLGPLLNTVLNMMSELSAFLLPFLVITAGFATSFYLVFNGAQLVGLNTFTDAMLMLFEAFLNSFDTSRWDDLPYPELRLFGILLLVAYLVLAGILLANLLIAIISYKYRPDEVAAQSVFGLAEVVDRHQLQVEGAMLCSPFCLLQVPFNLLPRGSRPAILPYSFFRLGMAPLEGFRPAAPHLNTVPTGRDAVPQLLFHLSLHPIMLVTAIACFFALSPLCVLYFAIHGYESVWEVLFPPKDAKAKDKKKAQGSKSLGSSLAASLAPLGSRGSSTAMSFAASAQSFAARPKLSGSFDSENSSAPGVLSARSGDPWQQVGGFCTFKGSMALAKVVGRTIATALVGDVLCCGVIGLFIVTAGGLYMWAACVVLSVYNVLYEPVIRIMAALAWHKWRRRMQRKKSSVVDGGLLASSSGSASAAAAPGLGPGGDPVEVAAGGTGPASDVVPAELSQHRFAAVSDGGMSQGGEGSGSGAAAGEAGRPRGAQHVTTEQVAQKWILLAKDVSRKRAAERYLTRQQVDAAIARTFGYSVSAVVAGAVEAATAARGGVVVTRKPRPGAGLGTEPSHALSQSAGLGGYDGAQPVADIHNMRTPYLNLRAAEERQEARDFAVLGRVIPGEHFGGPGYPWEGAAPGPGGLARAQPGAGTGGSHVPEHRVVANAAAAARAPSGQGARTGDGRTSDGVAARPVGEEQTPVADASLEAKLDRQAVEIEELRSQLDVVTGLLVYKLYRIQMLSMGA